MYKYAVSVYIIVISSWSVYISKGASVLEFDVVHNYPVNWSWNIMHLNHHWCCTVSCHIVIHHHHITRHPIMKNAEYCIWSILCAVYLYVAIIPCPLLSCTLVVTELECAFNGVYSNSLRWPIKLWWLPHGDVFSVMCSGIIFPMSKYKTYV